MQWITAWRFFPNCHVWKVFAAWGCRCSPSLQQSRDLEGSMWWRVACNNRVWVRCSRSICPSLGRSNHNTRWDAYLVGLLSIYQIPEGTSKCKFILAHKYLFLLFAIRFLTFPLNQVFDSSRARERERELLYPDACGGGARGWISQGMATYGRGHGTRETCALHTTRLSVDTLVDFWTALGEETRQSLLKMKEEDFIERLMYRCV